MKFICVSDTHNQRIPRFHGDCLIHAGDLTIRGTEKELTEAAEHLAGYPCRKIIIVPGNHDILFETDTQKALDIFESRDIQVLMGKGTEIGGVKIFGQHGQPECWGAFGYDGYEKLEPWEAIPNDTEILITHCPPKYILDLAPNGSHLGCSNLSSRVTQVVKPSYHVFGHIHLSYGRQEYQGTTFINAAICSETNQAINPPISFNFGLPGSYERY